MYKRDKAKISERKRGRKKKVAVVCSYVFDVGRRGIRERLLHHQVNNNDELPQYFEQIDYPTSSDENILRCMSESAWGGILLLSSLMLQNGFQV